MPANESLILPSAILFDMDGTLTEPMLDFPRIKAEMGIGERPILEAMAEMSPAQRELAKTILDHHEEEAARLSSLNAGCRQLLDWLEQAGVPIALITRNSRASVETVLRRHALRIEVLVAREDAPPKPSPEPLRVACRRLSVPPSATWMVGDGQYDIEAGLAAGVPTVWIRHDRPTRPFAAVPWREVRDLLQLHGMLQAFS